ncbi:MAG: hypothetical protein LBL44_12230 [Treponema sp.]|jgi:hypothetical protein|nr:hypothetical protein [Treponema sp.]
MKMIPLVMALIFPASLPALDVWTHPEAAEKNSLFLDVHFSSLAFESGFAIGIDTLEFHLDYMPPIPLPFSLGVYLKAPNPNLKNFGARLGYHFDVADRKTDIYFFYAFDFGFLRNSLLAEHGDEEQPLRLYDFRAGVRRVFNRYFCMVLETDYKISGVLFGVAIKIL